MTPAWILLYATLCLTLPALAWLAWRSTRLSRLCRIAQSSCQAARDGEEAVTRSLQLFAHELQSLALTFRGHVDRLTAERHDNAPSMAAAAAQLANLADELGHHLMPNLMPGSPARALSCETIDLADLVADAVGTVAAAIRPGRRHWRVARGQPVPLWADRRALRLVLVRVMGEAVRSSAHDDWIDIGWSVGPAGLSIRVEDEGAGTAIPGLALAGPAGARPDSRGIGLRLSLARSLTQAHGGQLDVEALAQIGTRVTIVLPPDRLHPPSPASSAPPPSLAPAGSYAPGAR